MFKKTLALMSGIAILAGTTYAITLPDLTVKDVFLNNNDKVTFELANESSVAAISQEDGFIYVYVDDKVAWTYNWKFLAENGFLRANGSSIMVSQVPKAKDRVRVCVDERNHVNESDESNNCAEYLIPDGAGSQTTNPLPDFVINDIYVDARSGNLVIDQGNKGITSGKSLNGRTKIYVGDKLKWTYNWASLGDRDFMAPGGSTKLQPTKFKTTSIITACVETEGNEEIDAKNNCLTKKIRGQKTFRKVPARVSNYVRKPNSGIIPKYKSQTKPDFAIEDIYLDENNVLTAKISNLGVSYRRSHSGDISVYIDGRKVKSYRWNKLSDKNFLISGGSSLLKTNTLNGAHQIKVCIDTEDRVQEVSDINNCLVKLVK